MLLTKRKRAQRRLISALKARLGAGGAVTPQGASLDHEKQLAVVDAVEWAVERWASRDLALRAAADPRVAHAARLIAALVYLDPRFSALQVPFVTRVIEAVVGAPEPGGGGPQLDEKAAAALLMVEVGAFRR